MPNPETTWMEADAMKMPAARDLSIPGRPSLDTPRPPVRVSSEGFDVLHEISTDGKTEEQLSKEIEEAVSGLRNPRKAQTPAMEVRDRGDALAAEIASNKGDALAQPTTEDQQEIVQEDLEASAGEAGPESIQDALQEKAQEKAEEIAKQKAEEAIGPKTSNDGQVKGTPKNGVRVRKASTTCFYHPNFFNLFRWYSC
jgi:hypothetical protein